jgi:hypothetical protein
VNNFRPLDRIADDLIAHQGPRMRATACHPDNYITRATKTIQYTNNRPTQPTNQTNTDIPTHNHLLLIIHLLLYIYIERERKKKEEGMNAGKDTKQIRDYAL